MFVYMIRATGSKKYYYNESEEDFYPGYQTIYTSLIEVKSAYEYVLTNVGDAEFVTFDLVEKK